MRTYMIDEMDSEQVDLVARHLLNTGHQSPMQGIIWIELPQSLLSERQKEHVDSCGPYILSLETGPTWIKLELLVRARQTFRCPCIGYATRQQRDFGQDLVDAVLDQLQIQV